MSDDAVMGEVIKGMNPTVRGIMYSILALPISIAISGLLLHVDVGNLITKYLDIKLAEAAANIPAPQHDDYAAVKEWICNHKASEKPGFCK